MTNKIMNRKESLKSLGLEKAYLRIDREYYQDLHQNLQKQLQAKKQELNSLLSDQYQIYQEAKPEWKEELQPASIANYLAYLQFYRNSKLPPEIDLIIEDQIIAEFTERQKDFYQVIKSFKIIQAEIQAELLEYSEILDNLTNRPSPSSPKALLPKLTTAPVQGEILQPPRLEAKTLQPMLKPLATWRIPFISQWSWNR